MGEAFVRIGKYERERGRSLGSIEDFVKRKRVEGRKGEKGGGERSIPEKQENSEITRNEGRRGRDKT